MYEFNSAAPRTQNRVIVQQNALVRQVYAWMGVGLAITAFMAMMTLSSTIRHNGQSFVRAAVN